MKPGAGHPQEPDEAEALHTRGVIGRVASALDLIEAATQRDPGNALFMSNSERLRLRLK